MDWVEKCCDWMCCRMKWQSISMCLVRSWNTGLAAMWMAARLSQKNGTVPACLTSKCYNNMRNHMILHVVLAVTRYSTSAEERETIVCFLERHVIGEDPRKMT